VGLVSGVVLAFTPPGPRVGLFVVCASLALFRFTLRRSSAHSLLDPALIVLLFLSAALGLWVVVDPAGNPIAKQAATPSVYPPVSTTESGTGTSTLNAESTSPPVEIAEFESRAFFEGTLTISVRDVDFASNTDLAFVARVPGFAGCTYSNAQNGDSFVYTADYAYHIDITAVDGFFADFSVWREPSLVTPSCSSP
jgi:hypothetical protein